MKTIWQCDYSWRNFVVDTDGGVIGPGNPPNSQPAVSSFPSGGSLTPDAYNQQITEASSFSVTINSGTRNAIQWIAAKDRVLIGTTGGEWRMSGHSNKPLTPLNYDLKPQTVRGSKDMQPLVVDDAVLFVDYVGKKLRELVYTGDTFGGRYISPDLTLLAEHITASGGITSMAHQKTPDSIIWLTLSNGDLISCTYEKEQEVVAWARHPISLGDEAGTDIPSTTEYVPDVSTDYPLLRTTTAQDDPQLPHVTAISNVEELQAIDSGDMNGNYYLTNNIDASDTSSWNSGAGFNPIGSSTNEFTGTFDGNGYTISNLFINRSTDYNGLFAKTENGAQIVNLTLSNVDITGKAYLGALVGQCDALLGSGTILIQNCHSTGAIKATGATEGPMGGLIGGTRGKDATDRCYVYDCSSACTVSNFDASVQVLQVGGLIGILGDGTVSNCFATGDVSVAQPIRGEVVGGFVGVISGDTSDVSYCYATGDATAEDETGGFVGRVDSDGSVSKCYATGNASISDDGAVAADSCGGFVGVIADTFTITDCYARGNATIGSVGTNVGGFVGGSGNGRPIDNCYSIGIPTGNALVGGFAGVANELEITNCFWDTETSGTETSDGGTGHTTVWLKTKTNYPSSWDFDTIWRMAGATPWLDVNNTNDMGANSVCVIPSTPEDEVWVTVSRAIDSNLVRYIERMKPRNWGPDQEDAFFVDSGLTYDSTPTDTFSGLGHLEGEVVAILGDGAVFPTQTVTSGSVTLAESVSVCHIGLPYTYKAKPMRLDQNTGRGTSKGSMKKIHEIIVSFYKTFNAKYGNGTTTREFKWRTTEPYTSPPNLFTGDKKATFDGGFSVEDPLEISGSDPTPCTVRCLIPRLDVTGR